MANLTRVQATGKGSLSNGTVCQKSFASAPGINSGIIVVASCWHLTNNTFPADACTDNFGNTYIRVVIAASGNNRGAAAIFYCQKVTSTGSPFTITLATDKASGNYISMAAVEISASNNAGIIADVSKGQTGGSTVNIATGNSAAGVSKPTIVVAAACQIASGEASLTVEAAPVWTQEYEELDFGTHIPGEGNSRLETGASGVISCSWTAATAGFWSGVVAAFISGTASAKNSPAIGTVSVLLGDIAYATPARAVNIEYLTAAAAVLEGSFDGITWVTLDTAPGAGMRFVNGVVAPYIRPSVDITVVFRKTKAKL